MTAHFTDDIRKLTIQGNDFCDRLEKVSGNDVANRQQVYALADAYREEAQAVVRLISDIYGKIYDTAGLVFADTFIAAVQDAACRCGKGTIRFGQEGHSGFCFRFHHTAVLESDDPASVLAGRVGAALHTYGWAIGAYGDRILVTADEFDGTRRSDFEPSNLAYRTDLLFTRLWPAFWEDFRAELGGLLGEDGLFHLA